MLGIAALQWCLIAMSQSTFAADLDEDIQRLYPEDFVSIATGRQMPLNLAPAIATVITADELDAVGATTLSEALRLVPGINVMYRPQGDLIVFRGIQSESNFNPEVLILLDGVSQNDIHFGSQRKYISQIPWQNVARIEIIRGPGSALYGADAFAGVINIITKPLTDVDTTEVRLRGGSFDTTEGRFLHKGQWGIIDSVFSLQLRTTDGHTPYTEEDAQTAWDRIFGTSASLAPTKANSWIDDYNILWDLSKNEWRLRLRTRAHELGGVGLVGALDRDGKSKSNLYSIDLRYQNPTFSDHWSVQWDLNLFDYKTSAYDTRLFPAGAFGGTFPDGVRDEPAFSESRERTEVSAIYSGFEKHATRIGAGVEFGRVYNIQEFRNYTLAPSGLPLPAPFMELTENELYSQENDRRNLFVYGQDEWSLARDWTFTSGLRYDKYSDFGSVTNPRLALVWATRNDLTTKFLAGRAFRAPTLFDIYGQNTPSIKGNTTLNPVTIDTYELAFDYRPRPVVRTGINVFYYDISDTIGVTQTPLGTFSANTLGQIGRGFEWTIRWEILSTLTLNGYYAHQDSELKESHKDPGYAPQNSVNVRLDWRFLPGWHVNTNVIWVADRKRPPNDLRPPTGDYTTVDLTLRYKPPRSHLDFGLSVFNVFDTDARDLSDSPGNLPFDLRLPRRSIFAEVRINWGQ